MNSGVKEPVAVFLLCLCFGLQATRCRADREPPGLEESYSAAPQWISLKDYPGRLARFHALVDGCLQAMTPPSCDWKMVGPDAAVDTPVGLRTVRFAWLRSALSSASAAAGKQDAQKAASDELRAADLLLDQELSRQGKVHSGLRNVASERASLKNILAAGGYAQEVPPTLFEKLRDQFLHWLESRLSAMGASQGSEVIVTLFLIGLVTVICAAMIWWLTRRVYSQRLLLNATRTPYASAPSAQDWQEWRDKGRGLAQKQQWREAVHDVYWSAISRLESRGLWPADRARTPREYLALLVAHPETRADLTALTRSFERIWYGDQAAGQPEFDHACALLERLAR